MDALDELERRFAAAIEADRQGRRAPRGRPRRRPRRQRPRRAGRLGGLSLATGGALAALAAVAVVALVVAAGGGRGEEQRRLPSAWVLLERVADAAEQAPPPPRLRDGELWYVRGVGVDQWALPGERAPGSRGREMFGVLRSYAVEQWSGTGAAGRVRRLTTSAQPRFEADRDLWRRTRRARRPFPPDRDVVFTHVRGLPLSQGLFAPQELRSLPTGPDALLQAVEAAVQRRSPQAVAGSDALATAAFEAIRGLLLLPVTPQHRAALLRAFARLPGTRVARIGRDARGRRGVVLVYTPRRHPRMPRVLVVDDENGRLLAERGPRGTPETTYVAQGVARDVRALPPGVAPPKARLPRTRHARQPRDPGAGP